MSTKNNKKAGGIKPHGSSVKTTKTAKKSSRNLTSSSKTVIKTGGTYVPPKKT